MSLQTCRLLCLYRFTNSHVRHVIVTYYGTDTYNVDMIHKLCCPYIVTFGEVDQQIKRTDTLTESAVL
jgi:hypothetical protein